MRAMLAPQLHGHHGTAAAATAAAATGGRQQQQNHQQGVSVRDEKVVDVKQGPETIRGYSIGPVDCGRWQVQQLCQSAVLLRGGCCRDTMAAAVAAGVLLLLLLQATAKHAPFNGCSLCTCMQSVRLRTHPPAATQCWQPRTHM
jgi:hypothetical protein